MLSSDRASRLCCGLLLISHTNKSKWPFFQRACIRNRKISAKRDLHAKHRANLFQKKEVDLKYNINVQKTKGKSELQNQSMHPKNKMVDANIEV